MQIKGCNDFNCTDVRYVFTLKLMHHIHFVMAVIEERKVNLFFVQHTYFYWCRCQDKNVF